MRSIQVGKGGTAFMINSQGITIADINSEIVGVEDCINLGNSDPKLKAFSNICKKMAAGQNGVGTYSYGGATKVVAYSPVPGTEGWSIGVAAIRSNFLGKFYLSLIFTIISVILFTFIGISNGVSLGKAVAKPIVTSVERLKLLAAGDLHSPAPVPESNDETALLMDSLAGTIQDLNMVIADISHHLAELSSGNFRISIDDTYKGDFAQISESFRGIVASLNDAMRNIDSNAESVQKGATDLAGAAQSLAEGATDQASAIEELTATITDISEKIRVNAKNADKVRTIVDTMNNQVIESNEQMKRNTDAMAKIREASNKIAEIISSIEEIADQTNLLALNASIEAARRGSRQRICRGCHTGRHSLRPEFGSCQKYQGSDPEFHCCCGGRHPADPVYSRIPAFCCRQCKEGKRIHYGNCRRHGQSGGSGRPDHRGRQPDSCRCRVQLRYLTGKRGSLTGTFQPGRYAQRPAWQFPVPQITVHLL